MQAKMQTRLHLRQAPHLRCTRNCMLPWPALNKPARNVAQRVSTPSSVNGSDAAATKLNSHEFVPTDSKPAVPLKQDGAATHAATASIDGSRNQTQGTLLVQCVDQKGVVAALSQLLFGFGKCPPVPRDTYLLYRKHMRDHVALCGKPGHARMCVGLVRCCCAGQTLHAVRFVCTLLPCHA